MLWVVGEVNEESPRERVYWWSTEVYNTNTDYVYNVELVFFFVVTHSFCSYLFWFGILLYVDGCYIDFNNSFLIINFIVEILCDVSCTWFKHHSPSPTIYNLPIKKIINIIVLVTVVIIIHLSLLWFTIQELCLCWCDSFLINICLMQLHDFVPCFLLNFLQRFYDPIFVELERVMLKLIKIWVTLPILLNYGLQVIAVNGKFPGPLINSTTNDNVNVNVHNDLDENLLMTWLVSAQYNIILVFFKH